MAKKTNALTNWIEDAKETYKDKLPKVIRDAECVTEFNVGYKDAKRGTNYLAGCMDKDTAEFFLKHLIDAFALEEATVAGEPVETTTSANKTHRTFSPPAATQADEE